MNKNASYKKSSIAKRISFTNIIIFLFVSLLSILGTLQLNIQYHVSRDAKMMDVYISNTLNSVDNKLKDMGRVSLIAFSDNKVQQILKGSGYTYKEELANEEYLKNLYSSLISIRDDIKGIYIFNNETMVFFRDSASPSLGLERNVDEFFQEVKSNADFETNISGCHLYMDGFPEGFRYSDTYKNDIFQRNNIYLVRPIRSFSPYEIIGYIALRTPIRKMKDICDEYLEKDISYIIADENNRIVCCSDENTIGESLSEYDSDLMAEITASKGSFSTTMDDRKYLCSYQKSNYSNMLLITMKTYSSIFGEIKELLIWCVLLAILCSVIVLISVSKMTRKNLKRLVDFSVEVENFQPDDLTNYYEIYQMDEVGILKNSFNKMIDRINKLVISEYRARDQLQKVEISEQKMAMLYLKQQINPHFLYNTLDMIRLKAAINGDAEVSEMLMKLVKFYRLSTRVHSSMVTVKEEVEMLDAYMSLMCYRYSELNYQTEISEEVLGLEIPNFTLQPLLENSLMHGLKDRRYCGTITLKIFKERAEEQVLSIWIIDDGVGISQEKLDELNGYSDENAESIYRTQFEVQGEATHLGVVNVISRLKLYYQDNCSIRYSKNETGGTSVNIQVKLESDEK
ncbi:MAG: histidine kinase [Blautia sp.]|nr:histidine kinase [Blautia sp.]MDY3997724.1 histidine kinase [Blautia sp.]